jgi:hypothetical protein
MSDINKAYAKAYKIFKEEMWRWAPSLGIFQGLNDHMIELHLNSVFKESFEAELEKVHKQVFPRRRIIKLENIPEEHLEPVREKWAKRAISRAKARYRQYYLVLGYLNARASEVDLTPSEDLHKVMTGDVTAHNSQGFGAYKYAKAPLLRTQDLLSKHGFYSEIREVYWGDVLDNPSKPNELYQFKLWTELEPYQLDALERRQETSLLDWATDCWKRGTNPKVYSPFLPDDIYDQSLVAAGFTP